MKTPTLQELIKHFKNAIIVKDAYTGLEFDLSEYDLENAKQGDSYGLKDDWIVFKKSDNTWDKIIYDGKKGYSLIVTSKT